LGCHPPSISAVVSGGFRAVAFGAVETIYHTDLGSLKQASTTRRVIVQYAMLMRTLSVGKILIRVAFGTNLLMVSSPLRGGGVTTTWMQTARTTEGPNKSARKRPVASVVARIAPLNSVACAQVESARATVLTIASTSGAPDGCVTMP
jgi:hypothetical protein